MSASMGTNRGNNRFVFVVCGGREHIETLHYALRALKRFARSEIIVLTDTQRNEIAIDWPHVVDVRTPEAFNHHQASIYLKTGIHRFVPPGPRYCYLDTDVVAVAPDVESMFDQKRGPITFAADHFRTHEFSPYAVRCECAEQNRREREELTTLKQAAYCEFPEAGNDPYMKTTSRDFERWRAQPWHMLRTYLRFRRTPVFESNRDEPPAYRWKSFWLETQETANLYQHPVIVRQIESVSPWRYNPVRKSWISPAGRDIYHLRCNHLVQQIECTFGIRVADPCWQHWNGGVFLFDTDSHAFLEAWHAKTMRIFADPAWLTRDQGTLIATAWELGLQDNPLLPPQFNFLADYYRPAVMLAEDNVHITTDAFLTRCQPIFVHVYHHFGDEDWPIWNWVHSRATGQ
jgi:hypothetical protein